MKHGELVGGKKGVKTLIICVNSEVAYLSSTAFTR